jgi:hypothetical protein
MYLKMYSLIVENEVIWYEKQIVDKRKFKARFVG